MRQALSGRPMSVIRTPNARGVYRSHSATFALLRLLGRAIRFTYTLLLGRHRKAARPPDAGALPDHLRRDIGLPPRHYRSPGWWEIR